MSNLIFGIIGYGSIAKKHISFIKRRFPNSQINVLLHKKIVKSTFKIKFFFTNKSFFETEYNYIFICNPCTRHVEYIKKCIKHKVKNIFVEKPLSHNFYQSKKFLTEHHKEISGILVGYVLLYNRLFLESLKILKDKKLGKIISATIVCNSNAKKWRKGIKFYKSVSSNKKLGGGVLNELSHELSYAIKLFGPIQSVFSKIFNNDNKKINVETEAKIICTTKGNINLGIFIDFLNKKEERFCEIIGTKGNLLLDFRNMNLTVNNKEILNISKKNKDQMYLDQLNFFTGRDKKKPQIISEKFFNALDVTKFIDAIKISSSKNKIVSLT
jgi:predicted dehydrogenase